MATFQTAGGRWVTKQLQEPGKECCPTCGVRLRPGLLKDDKLSNIAPGHYQRRTLKCRKCRAAYEVKRRVEQAETERQLEEEMAFVRSTFKDMPPVSLADLIAADTARRNKARSCHSPVQSAQPRRQKRRTANAAGHGRAKPEAGSPRKAPGS